MTVFEYRKSPLLSSGGGARVHFNSAWSSEVRFLVSRAEGKNDLHCFGGFAFTSLHAGSGIPIPLSTRPPEPAPQGRIVRRRSWSPVFDESCLGVRA